jgi:hypothetical protein
VNFASSMTASGGIRITVLGSFGYQDTAVPAVPTVSFLPARQASSFSCIQSISASAFCDEAVA